jgi:rod shape-determining protein MreC
MQGLIDFVIKFKNYISFVALVVISLSLISMGSVNKIGGFRTIVIGSMGWFQEIFAWVPNPAAVKNENKALRELNLQLSTEVTRMREAVVENRALRNMLNYSQKPDYPFETVEIVGRTTLQMRDYMMINKGKNSGLLEGMPVRTDAGLVGILIGASNNYGLLEVILNRDIKISAKCQRSQYPGLIVWEGGEFMLMKNVPKSYDIKTGDIIITSNYSQKYPENIPIGEVIVSREEKGELFLKIVVKPLVNFATVEQAFVLKQLPNPEKSLLINEIDEKLKLRKLEAKKTDKIYFEKKKKSQTEEKKK